MTALIAFTCITMAATIMYAAFFYGRQIGYTLRDNESLKQEQKAMQEQIDHMALEYRQLEVQYNQEKQDNQRVRPGGWDPGQLSTREYNL